MKLFHTYFTILQSPVSLDGYLVTLVVLYIFSFDRFNDYKFFIYWQRAVRILWAAKGGQSDVRALNLLIDLWVKGGASSLLRCEILEFYFLIKFW